MASATVFVYDIHAGHEMKRYTGKYYTAYVDYTIRIGDDLVTKTAAQDVTDELNECDDTATREALVDRIYWNELSKRTDVINIVGGGIREE